MINFTNHHSHILVGQYASTEHYVLTTLTHLLSADLSGKQHHQLVWIEPEKQYTVELLEPVFTTTSYLMHDEQRMYIVIHKADFLTPTTSASLLKRIEEPPAGYTFIFIAQRKEALLETIQSRSIIHYLEGASTTTEHPLLAYFTQSSDDFIGFKTTLEDTKPTEQETLELIEQLLAHWYKQPNSTGAPSPLLSALHHALEYPPMPGSSKIFWKNLFLTNLLTRDTHA